MKNDKVDNFENKTKDDTLDEISGGWGSSESTSMRALLRLAGIEYKHHAMSTDEYRIDLSAWGGSGVRGITDDQAKSVAKLNAGMDLNENDCLNISKLNIRFGIDLHKTTAKLSDRPRTKYWY